MSGPLLHELLHLWGGADIIPYFQTRLDEPGAGGDILVFQQVVFWEVLTVSR